MTTNLDYGITIGATVYDKYWTSCSIKEMFGSPSTFSAVITGSATSDFATITVGADFKLYQYDNVGSGTLRFLGIINTVKRIGFNQMKITGYDYGGKLINSQVSINKVATLKEFESGDTDTLATIVNKLVSSNLDGSSPWTIVKGTVDDPSTVIGKFKVPMISRWEALVMLARRAGKEIYINQTTGTLNLVNSRGNSSSQKTYNLTGASTNAYSSMHEFTNNNIHNDIMASCASKDLTTRFQDMSTTFCKMTVSDTRVTTPVVGSGGGFITTYPLTIDVVSTDGFPATGRVVIKQCLTGLGVGNIYFDYTSKTATSITGSLGLPAARAIPTGVPVLLASVIIVDDNSDFPASGSIVIGEELIDYSAKPSSTTFTVAQVQNYARYSLDQCLSTGTNSATATTINVDDTTGFPTTGSLSIYATGHPIEIVTYTGITGTSFTGCMRAVNGTKDVAIDVNTPIILYSHEGIHPKGVLVYKYVATADANSSIGSKGRHTYTLRLENVTSLEDLEAQTSRFLELHKWGDQKASLTVPTFFDYGVVALGDKITLNDSTLDWSSYEVRVLQKNLNLDRNSGEYELLYNVATYSDDPAEGNLSKDGIDFVMRMTGAKEGTVAQSGKDTDVKATGEGNSIGGLNFGFQPPGGTALFTNENKNGYVFSNYFWSDGTSGSSYFSYPFYSWGVAIDMNGVFSPISAAAASPPTGRTGGIYYDSTNNKLQYYNGSSWGDIGGGGSSLWTAGSGYIYPTTSSVNILPNTTGEIGSSASPWAAVYGSVLYAATRISMKYSATYYQAFSLSSSTEISCSLPFIPSSDDAKWLGTPSSRWARIWGVGGYFGAADAHVLCYRNNSSGVNITGTGSSSNISLSLSGKGTGFINLLSTAISSDVIPTTNLTKNLGSTSNRWSQVYSEGVSINAINFRTFGGSHWEAFVSAVSSEVVAYTDLYPGNDAIYSLGTSSYRWLYVYAGSGRFGDIYLRSVAGATDWKAISSLNSGEINLYGNVYPSVDDSKWLGNTSHRWARIWGVGGYFGAADSHVLCYRGSSSQAVIQATGNSASVGLVLQTKNAMPITLNDIAVLAGGAQTNLGIYIGLFAANQLLDDSTHGTGSTTLYIGDETIDTTASDRRMKKNIVDSSVDTFKILDKMRIVDFEWKSGRTGKYTGLIAQEVDEYLPQVVKKPSNPEEIGWAVEYHHLVPYLILALKKLDERVKELEFIAQKSNDKTEIEV